MSNKKVLCIKFKLGECLASKKKRFSLPSDLLELFLWLILFGFVVYTFTPDIISLTFPSPSSSVSVWQNHEMPITNMRQKHHPHIPINPLLKLTMTLYVGDDSNTNVTVLTNQVSKQFIVPEKYRKSEESNSINFDLDREYLPRDTNNSTLMIKKRHVIMNDSIIRLKCAAPYPIQLVYSGNGRPRFETIYVEKKYFDEVFELIYIVMLDFGKVQLESMDTGRYTCEAVSMQNLNVEEALKRRQYIDIFVPGVMKLLHQSLVDGSLFLSNVAPILIYHDVKSNGEKITVPCSSSKPSGEASLHHKSHHASDEISDFSYDPIYGFQLPLKALRDSSGRYSKNDFYCVSRESAQKLLFKVLIKNAFESRVSPPSTRVSVLSDSLPIQVFECESNEPIEIRWFGGPPVPVLSEAVNQTFKVSFIATPRHLQRKKSSVARFQCSRKRDGMLIHIWEWTGNGVTKPPHLSYNRNSKKLSCCMNSVHAPQLFVESCSTMLECKVKASFQPKITSAGRSLSNEKGCRVWIVPNGFQAGLIMCNQVNSNPFRDPSQKTEFPPVFVKWNDDVVVIGNGLSSKPLESLVTMKVSEHVVEEGKRTEIKIECLASSMLFAGGLRWTMYMQNGDVSENVQWNSTWSEEADYGVISYQEVYRREQGIHHGVLSLRTSAYAKPLLQIGETEKEGQAVKLRLSNKISKLSCEAPMWNDTNIWIEAHVNKIG